MEQQLGYYSFTLNDPDSVQAAPIQTAKAGAWSAAEDERLRAAIAKHGARWTSVAAEVATRNGEQCAKRWNDHVNPLLDHGPWSTEEDKTLLDLVTVHGHNWKLMADTYHKSRSPLSLKNRYALLSRRQRRHNNKRLQSSVHESETHALEGHFAVSSLPSSRDQGHIPEHDEETRHFIDWLDLNGAAENLDGSIDSSRDMILSGEGSRSSHPQISLASEGDSNINKGKGSESGVEFSVTCTRAKLKAMVCHAFEGAMLDASELSDESQMTVTLRLKR